MNRRLSSLAPALFLAAWAPLAHAQRADASMPAQVIVRSECMIAPAAATELERSTDSRESALVVALGMIAANIAGQLVSSGINAIGQAIDSASAEHGFVAEGSTNFQFYQVRHPTKGRKLADVRQPRTCLVLWVPGGAAAPPVESDASLQALSNAGRGAGLPLRIFDDGTKEAATQALGALGITMAPKVYVEAELIPIQEGMIVRPVLAWYREALPGAPKALGVTQSKATFATPSSAAGSTDIGAVFASVDIALDRMHPGMAVGSTALARHTFIAIPTRPTAGAVETTLAGVNSSYSAVSTLQAEERVSVRAAAVARRKAETLKTAEAREAADAADMAAKQKSKDLSDAQAGLAELRAADDASPRQLGTTNVKARIVFIRDANKWGQAIAKALKSQAEATGTAVTSELKPKTEWTAADTGLVSAQISVQGKQAEYDDAVSAGTANAAKLADELTVLKARANEAAVSAGAAPPYPGLLDAFKD